ncbi:Pkinase-domain-containing protein [Zopfia rhizophila CBS 207.26]|uniref:Pkinase-domain-containing protein n=1 Tax=Zopfia rhizophila CBS 207.26 TaxID=1314779 RepID=A0A6A6DVU7_9PEZI|nr:Pkinase-domain-containing protein [Zopfia rhizophila CBS 207.26]
MVGEVVAYLDVLLAGGDPDETQGYIEIRGSEEFFLGRNSVLCRHHWLDKRISNKHLRIHCVLYEQDPVAGIPPFVYATDVSTNGTYLKKSNIECTSSQGQCVRMCRKNGSYLLDDGDELRISDSVTLIYRSLIPAREDELNATQQREKKLFSSRYLITNRILGIGGYGKVMVGIHQRTQQQLACKVIDLRHLYWSLPKQNLRLPSGDREPARESRTAKVRKRWPTRVGKCFREFDILKDLHHPNIINLKKVFWSSSSIYIFQELVAGGDLFSYLEYKGGSLCDVEAAVIVRQILKGVEYLHEHDIVHRDLKPDNILMTSLDDGARIVITDFGNARFIPKTTGSGERKALQKKRMFSLVGTLEYTAPEVHKVNKTIPAQQGYSKSVDMWSIGSITVALLSGDVIFTDRAHPSYERNPRGVILALASRCDLSVLDSQTHPIWSKASTRPKDFIKNLLVLEEEYRLTATEALTHPWFSNKYHAAEFDALYERAVRDWHPRRKVFKLVEAISQAPSTLTESGLPEVLLSQEVVLAASLNYRVDTPLPSIAEEFEGSQFKDQALMQSSYELGEPSLNDHSLRPFHQHPIGNSMDLLTLDPKTAEISSMDGDAKHGERTRSCESVTPGNSAMSVKDGASVSLVHSHTPEAQPDSSIVRETPIRSVKKRQPLDYETLGKDYAYEQESQESASGEVAAKYFIQEVSKRRKLGHELR